MDATFACLSAICQKAHSHAASLHACRVLVVFMALCSSTNITHLIFINPFLIHRALVVFMAVVMDGSFAAALIGFLVMHAQLIAANCTTIEMYEKDRLHPWPYNKCVHAVIFCSLLAAYIYSLCIKNLSLRL